MTVDAARTSWARIERWFGEHHPSLSLGLRPPATTSEIDAAESTLGAAFPADFRESLLVHDGQEDWPGVSLLPIAQRLGSLTSLVGCWVNDRTRYDEKEMAERLDWLDDARRVRQVQLHPKHVPIAGSQYWDYDRLLLDLAPGPDGTSGQVIARDDIDHAFLCASFGELLAKTAKGLEDGRIAVVEGLDISELEYRTPRSKKPMSAYAFFA